MRREKCVGEEGKRIARSHEKEKKKREVECVRKEEHKRQGKEVERENEAEKKRRKRRRAESADWILSSRQQSLSPPLTSRSDWSSKNQEREGE